MFSKCHAKLKKNYEARNAEGKQQLTLYDTEVRSKLREKEQEGAIYDFVRAFSYSGVALSQADSFIGDFVKKYCSKLRKLQHPTRSSMSAEVLRMNMTLYFNQDIQGHFCNY